MNNITTGFNIDDSDKYTNMRKGTNMPEGNFMTATSRDKIKEANGF
jgi:hypothetical protein